MKKAASTCNIKGKYLFSWDDILGADNEKFVSFISQSYSISWIKSAKFEKIDAKTIRASTEKNNILLKLDEEKTN
jgi:hypothetical protein